MKNSEIITTYYSLTTLKNKQEIIFSSKVAYAIIRNLKILQPIVEDIENVKNSLIEQYGDPVENQPGYYKEKQGCEGKLFNEIDKLMETETSLLFQYIKSTDLDGINLTLNDMEALYFMIKDGEG